MFWRVRMHLAIFFFLLCLCIVALFIIMTGPMLNQSPVSLGANRAKASLPYSVVTTETQTWIRNSSEFRIFQTAGDKLMYLYDAVLSSTSWALNRQNLAEFRSNFPPIPPYAVDAGWKSNLTTMNPSVAQRKFNSLKLKENARAFARATKDYSGILWLPCVASTTMISLCLKAKHTLDFYGVRIPETTVANPLHFLAVSDFWKDRNLTHFLSTGFYMTHLALTMCEETHLYGFWPFPSRVTHTVTDRVTDRLTNMMRKVKYHYFDRMPGPGEDHAMHDEFLILLQMHAQGILNLHVKDCVTDTTGYSRKNIK